MDHLTTFLPEIIQNHLFFGIVLAAVLVVLVFIRPKAMLKIVSLLIVLGLIVYFISLFGGSLSTGIDSKDDMIHKTERTID